MSYLDYLSDPKAYADLAERKMFLNKLMLAMKAKNIGEGVNIFQYLNMMQKIKNWAVTIPNGYPYAGTVYTINLLDCCFTGDIESLAKALDWGRSNCDDMSQSYHFLSEARLDWILSELKAYLGWA
jgi:hypothetical protein